MVGKGQQRAIPPSRAFVFVVLYSVTIGPGVSLLIFGEYAIAGLLLIAAAVIAAAWIRYTRQFRRPSGNRDERVPLSGGRTRRRAGRS